MSFDFATVLIFLVFGFLFAWALLALSGLLQRKNPTAAKLSTYECGETPVGSAWVQFNVRFYVIALIFIVFDVEIAFVYPCAIAYKSWVERGLGVTAFLEILLFIGILLAGLAYVWARGDLNWVKSISPDTDADEEPDSRARTA